MANSRGERFAFGMKRPTLSVSGNTVPGQFLDRASEKWNVVCALQSTSQIYRMFKRMRLTQVRSTMNHLDSMNGGQLRFQDLVGLCKVCTASFNTIFILLLTNIPQKLSCNLPEEDIDRLWSAISFGGRDGIILE